MKTSVQMSMKLTLHQKPAHGEDVRFAAGECALQLVCLAVSLARADSGTLTHPFLLSTEQPFAGGGYDTFVL